MRRTLILLNSRLRVVSDHKVAHEFTWIRGQVLEVHRLADLSVRRPAELHLHADRLRQVGVAVRRRAEHDGHLPVDVSLREGAFALPRVPEKTHLDVLWGNKTWTGTITKRPQRQSAAKGEG